MNLTFVPQAYAQGATASSETSINLGDELTLGIGGGKVSDSFGNIGDLVNILTTNLFFIAGIVLLFTLFLAGFKFMQGTTKGKDEAKQIVSMSIIGFILMFSAYWIVQIVQLITGADIGF